MFGLGAPYVGEDPRLSGGGGSHVTCDSPMPSRALVTWEPPVNRPTDMTENITFSHPVANGKIVFVPCLTYKKLLTEMP